DDLYLWVALVQRRQQRLLAMLHLVVARNQDGDQRLVLKHWNIAAISPGPVPFPVPPKIQAAGDPQARHEQWIEEEKSEQCLTAQHECEAERCTQHNAQNK